MLINKNPRDLIIFLFQIGFNFTQELTYGQKKYITVNAPYDALHKLEINAVYVYYTVTEQYTVF